MKRIALSAALLAMLAVPPTSADVPSTMSYQGVLTDGGGSIVPDGNYNLEFNIYDVSVAGVPLWAEPHAATPVTLGGFSVILGSSVPLNLAFDKQYWLGVKVNANPELAPRVALASSPYGLSLRLPFAGSAASANPLIHLQNTGAGNEIELGSLTDNGRMRVYQNGLPDPVVDILAFEPDGGGIDIYDGAGNISHWIEADFSGAGGYLGVASGTVAGFFEVDGNFGAGDPRVRILGTGSSMEFDANESGDPSVVLPNSAVSAIEILDEPGISQHRLASSNVVVSDEANMMDVITTTIDIPGPGYVVVEAAAQHRMVGTTAGNYINLQIDETAGGNEDDTYFASGYQTTAPSGSVWSPVNQRRTYFKVAAGSYTFRLEARKGTATGTSYMWNPVITATYYPTSYGTVTESVEGIALSDFSDVRYATPSDNGAGARSSSGAVADLRQLELRVAQLKAQTREAELQLIKAKRGQGQSAQLND